MPLGREGNMVSGCFMPLLNFIQKQRGQFKNKFRVEGESFIVEITLFLFYQKSAFSIF